MNNDTAATPFVPLDDAPSSSSLSPSSSLTRAQRRYIIRGVVVAVLVAGCIAVAVFVNNFFKSHRGNMPPWCESWVREHHAVPDAVSSCPPSLLTIMVNDTAFDYAHNYTDVAAVYSATLATLRSSNVSPGSQYVVWIVDPDFPSASDPRYRSRVHGGYVNVSATDSGVLNFNDSVAVFNYSATVPPVGTGYHRYLYLVYDHTGYQWRLPVHNGSLPNVGVTVENFMAAIFSQDLSSSMVSGNLFYTGCPTFSLPYCVVLPPL